nr:MAG TPA: hypothetical protein [Caudoviricetes sp.]
METRQYYGLLIIDHLSILSYFYKNMYIYLHI